MKGKEERTKKKTTGRSATRNLHWAQIKGLGGERRNRVQCLPIRALI